MHAPRHTPLVILLLVIAGAAGFGVYQWMAAPAPQAPAQGAMPPAAKTMAPDEALKLKFDSLDGTGSRSLADFKGKTLLVNYWATWCQPCRQEIPLLVKLQAQYAAQGLQVVGIATDETDAKDVKTFLKRMVVNYPMLMGTDDVGSMVAAFGGSLIGLPYTLVLGKDGKVLAIHAGELHPDEAQTLVQAGLASKAPASGSDTAPSVSTGAVTTAK
ncbi:MAG TPA: TlpA disulfide reductase family protein [Gammaproteobacteria bacterium]|nr:TlpA disulfide reductase family protein [Gammaproteobacteria bacterium]